MPLSKMPVGTRVKGYFPLEGIYRGQGYVELTPYTSSEEDEEEMNEWTDEVWRNELALGSIVKLRQVRNSTFFGSGKVI